LGAVIELAERIGGSVAMGIFGERVQNAANSLAIDGVEIFGVQGPDFAYPRYSTDTQAVETICREASADIVVAPATSRLMRVMPGVAQRMQGRVDTHITALEVIDGAVSARRWFYRQRLEGLVQRQERPWFLVMDPGCHTTWNGPAGSTVVKELTVSIPTAAKRTIFGGIRLPKSIAQTIRPDAKLLFVAGAGWCKKQADGKAHVAEAESTILEFLRNSGASLGGSKSLVDQSGENQAVLGFMTHLNQVGQTGSTPRHPKGLSTCCHGEEPHVVGWRFINERRAINLDPNCGWARGKADVLYVGDAFQVISKLTLLLAEKSKHEMVTVG
jgi:electron transfer flavoprotein alpha subunit